MRGFKIPSNPDHDSTPTRSTPNTPSLRPTLGERSISRQSARSILAQLHEDSEWSPPLDRKLSKEMPIFPDRYPFCWSKTPKPVDSDHDTVWLFDNTAFRLNDSPNAATKFPHTKSSHAFIDPALDTKQPPPPPCWQVEYVAAYFAKRMDQNADPVAKAVLRILGLRDDDIETLETIRSRLEPIMTPILQRSTIRINIANIETQTLGPGSSFGISSSVNRLHFDPSNAQQVVTTAAIPSSTRPDFLLPCNTILAEPVGWGVISDIDDTIKITLTSSPIGILKTTLVDDPQAVPGMPELYVQIERLLSSPAWFYLSASPYTLYSFLQSFRKAHYPDGSIILRDASWQNLAGLTASLTVGVQEYKVNRMMKMHGWFPKRSFICIGDSTQRDPESYGEIARKFPGWIKAIFIRKVSGVSSGVMSDPDEKVKNSPERFEKAFEGLSRVGCTWTVFETPDEVARKIAEILTTKFLPERVIEL